MCDLAGFRGGSWESDFNRLDTAYDGARFLAGLDREVVMTSSFGGVVDFWDGGVQESLDSGGLMFDRLGVVSAAILVSADLVGVVSAALFA